MRPPPAVRRGGGARAQVVIPVVATVLLVLMSVTSYVITLYLVRPLKRASKQILAAAKLDVAQIPDAAGGLHVQELDEMTEGIPCPPALSARMRCAVHKGGGDERARHRRQPLLMAHALAGVAAWSARCGTALASMRSSLRSFSKYVPQDVVRLLMRERREAILGVDETDITVRGEPMQLLIKERRTPQAHRALVGRRAESIGDHRSSSRMWPTLRPSPRSWCRKTSWSC